MNWNLLTDASQIETIIAESAGTAQVIFKHSTRCSISSVAKNRLEKSSTPDTIPFYYLDLITYRDLSNKISERFKVHHESPQVLVIKKGECIYEESHLSISMDEIIEQATI